MKDRSVDQLIESARRENIFAGVPLGPVVSAIG